MIQRLALLSAGVLACMGLAACGGERREDAPLEVYAAASLRDALLEVVALFEQETGSTVAVNFGSSGGLARQILAARRADVFFSAGEPEMDRVDEAGLILEGSRQVVLSNLLVVIEPASRESLFDEPFDVLQLKRPELERLSIGDPRHVPAGRYAKSWLEQVGVWSSSESRMVFSVDARAAMATVESGIARAGVVYASDAALSDRVRVVHEVPSDKGPEISYPVAALAGRADTQRARAFLEHLRRTQVREVFARYGFVVLSE